MTYPQVQFVAAPEDGAAVLFDFNDNFGDAPAQILDKTFNLGTPSVEGDPDGLGVQYGPRTLAFTLLIFGNRDAARQTQALLARTFMLRRRGWIRVQIDEFAAPVWLRTYTPTPGELDFELVALDDRPGAWKVDVEVAAEPFIRGARVTFPLINMTNNPAAATNKQQVLLPAVVGDAPAPIRIEAAFSSPRDRHDILWATSAVPASYTAPIVWQIGTGDGWSVGGDTSAPASDAQFSGGSYRSVSYVGTAAFATRLAGVAPSSPPVGRYKVFLRAARDTGSGTHAIRFGYRRGGIDRFDGSPTAILDYGNAAGTMLDLGEFDFPLPRTDADVVNGAALPSIALSTSRLTPGSALLLDAFVLVPVDLAGVTSLESWEKADVLVSEFGAYGPLAGAGETQVWDGDAEVSLRRVSGVSDAISSPACRGKFPTVRPGVSNLLTMFQQTRSVAPIAPSAPASITSTATAVVSYQPRWLWLGDG